MAATTGPQVFLAGGLPLTSLAQGWGELKITDRWPFGCWEASWTVPVRQNRRLAQLRAGSPILIRYGASPIWRGFMSEPNWDTGEMTALGLVRQGETTLALSSTGATSATPDEAIDQAIARGAVQWTRRTSISGVAFADPAQSSNATYLNPLLNAYTTTKNLGWGVGPSGEVYAAADPVAPSWFVMPDSGVLGIADDAAAATVVGRYLASGGGYANVSIGSGSPEIGVDLSNLGTLDGGQALAKISGIRDQLQARRGWVNGLTLAATQITSPGGARANLTLVKAGQMMRLHGLRDERGRSASTDFVIGERTWDVSDRTIQCNPVAMVARDLGSIVEDAGGVLLDGL